MAVAALTFGVAASVGSAEETASSCMRDIPPVRMTWLYPDDPDDGGKPGEFFYVNQDIVAGTSLPPACGGGHGLPSTNRLAGRKSNQVAQLVEFALPRRREGKCQLLLSLPRETSRWSLVQREGPSKPAVRVHSILGAPSARLKYGDLMDNARLLDTWEVRPGTQTIDLGSCDDHLRFLFEVAESGHCRVAFNQKEGDGGYGILVRYGCSEASKASGPTE